MLYIYNSNSSQYNRQKMYSSRPVNHCVYYMPVRQRECVWRTPQPSLHVRPRYKTTLGSTAS